MMKRLTNGLIAIGMAFSAIAATPTITGVTAQQRYPWNGKVDISYTVTGDIAAEAKERGLLTSLKVTATDRDANTTYTATALSGDRSLAAGTHSIVWDMDAQGLSFKSSNVVFSVACEATPALYCVIDLSAGANASSYPVTYLAAPPSGGFNVDTYKTTKLVLRRISKGTNSAGGAIANDMWVGIFEITKSQWLRVDSRDDVLIYGDLHGESRPADAVPIERIQKDFLPAIRNRTGIPGFCLPTEAEWEYACRAGTTTKYNNGRDDENGLKLVGRYDGNRAPGWAGPNHYHAIVGSYVPNAWGLYDMHGNVKEWVIQRGDGIRRLRGGSYNGTADQCTASAITGNLPPGDYGFRLFCSIESFDCPIGEGVTVIGLTSGTRMAATSETIRYSTSYSTMDGCAWIHSVCAPSAWEPSHNNVLRGIEVKHDGTRYVETDRVSASDPLSRLSDGVVNPAGESYGNTIGLKDGTLTWTLLEPMNISRLHVNTHWQDGGGDGISFIRVEYLQNGSETWTVLPNSTKLL